MPQALILPSALNELDEIWLYIARDNINAAEKLVNNIRVAANRLAFMPGIGRRRDELQVGLLSYPLGNYILFYRRTKTGIDLLHVYHGARNIEELFKHNRE
jgi:toxin ParE1/3/4